MNRTIITTSKRNAIVTLMRDVVNYFVYDDIISEELIHKFTDFSNGHEEESRDFYTEAVMLISEFVDNIDDYLLVSIYDINARMFKAFCHFVVGKMSKKEFERTTDICKTEGARISALIIEEAKEFIRNVANGEYQDLLQNSTYIMEAETALEISDNDEFIFIVRYLKRCMLKDIKKIEKEVHSELSGKFFKLVSILEKY